MLIETRVFFLSSDTPWNAYLISVGIKMRLPYYIFIDSTHHLNFNNSKDCNYKVAITLIY